ncbi:MAG: YkyB family protein [Bacillus sp. (in: firmicutes)]
MEPNKKTDHAVGELELSQAIFTINKHAKAAPKPKALYELKQSAIKKMLKEGKAHKLGLHFSNNPRNAKQHSDVIVQCGEYVFHLPPSKEDIKSLPHLGNRAADKRNPKTYMSLSKAKSIIYGYIGVTEIKKNNQPMAKRPFRPNRQQPKNMSSVFTSSFLGRD